MARGQNLANEKRGGMLGKRLWWVVDVEKSPETQA